MVDPRPGALSSEVDAGPRQENAEKQGTRAGRAPFAMLIALLGSMAGGCLPAMGPTPGIMAQHEGAQPRAFGRPRGASPFTAAQNSELARLAAGPNAPEGLAEALAAVEENTQRQACMERTRAAIQQTQTMGTVGSMVGMAGGMAGAPGKAMRKTLAIGNAVMMRNSLRQMQPC